MLATTTSEGGSTTPVRTCFLKEMIATGPCLSSLAARILRHLEEGHLIYTELLALGRVPLAAQSSPSAPSQSALIGSDNTRTTYNEFVKHHLTTVGGRTPMILGSSSPTVLSSQIQFVICQLRSMERVTDTSTLRLSAATFDLLARSMSKWLVIGPATSTPKWHNEFCALKVELFNAYPLGFFSIEGLLSDRS